MSNSNKPGPIFDGRFVITMVLVFASWVGWQSYLAKKYPEAYKEKQAQAPVSAEGSTAETSAAAQTQGTTPSADGRKVINEKPETEAEKQVLSFDDAIWSFQVSSHGMAIEDVQLKKYTDRKHQPISFATENDFSLFGTGLMGRRSPIHFQISRSSETEFVGTAQIEGMKIVKIMQVDSETYTIRTQVRAESVSDSFTGFITRFSDKIIESESGMFFMPQFEHQEFFAFHEGSDSRDIVSNKATMVETYAQTKIAAFGSQYFAAGILDLSPVMAEFRAATALQPTPHGVGTLTHALLNKADRFAIEYVAFVGPKSYDLLKSIDSDLATLVNLGFFQSISRAIQWLMKAIYSVFGNWGVAIIFLTILVRILVLPFNLIGYKQMKAMTKIQPQMKALREKYKAEPQKLNQEMLTLMKEAKANPLGGCLPMFLQIPIFFALYQVIGQSIDLYQAPFMLWISDLSLKDPFYILPVLMGVTMYFQQKITPNTLEPAQQKIMMFLPILFTFLMVSLPSGLTLYIFVSSVFGVLQQLYFMRDNRAPATA